MPPCRSGTARECAAACNVQLPKCCDPYKEPSKFGNPMCFEGHACCPSTGLWACSIGDGKTFPCGGTDLALCAMCPEDVAAATEAGGSVFA